MNPRFLFVIIFGGVVLGGMLFVFQPKSAPQNQNTYPAISVAPTVSKEKTFSLEVKEGKLISGSKILTVTQGDTVIITITADEVEELHVHGYDAFVNLEPNKTAKLTFVVDQAGHFPYELEHAGVEIGALEVQPK